MNRVVLSCVAACAAVLTACGGAEVIVQGQVEGPDGQPVALRQLPVQALPYDRDVLFDSLASAYAEPEPQIPAELMALRDSIAQARDQWTLAEQRWGTVRDSLQKANERLQQLNRASGEYVVLYRAIAPLFDEEARLKRQSEQSFQRFTNLDRGYAARADSLKLARDAWGDAAYADINEVIDARLKSMRLEIHADTTDDNGIVRFTGLKNGQWWIHARYDLPFEELYWNLPVTVSGGQTTVQLNRQTAQVRPKL
jgi:hypothetical protein